MRYAGIDVAAEKHAVAVVDERGEILQRAALFGEDAEGHARLRGLLGSPEGLVVALEATGHYWQNLVAAMVADGYAVALLNPLRTRRFAEEDLARAKTDEIDALVIARMAAQKRLGPTALPDAVTQQLREAVRLRERI